MARYLSNDLSKNLRKSPLSSQTKWAEAVRDTAQQVRETKIRLDQLLLSLEHFKRMRDSGEPWPESVGASVGEPKTETRRLLHE